MAKALFGHVGVGPDQRLAAEVRRLQSVVLDLEEQLRLVRATNDALLAGVLVEDDARNLTAEPALT